MFRKSLIALTAAAALSLGMAATAQAKTTIDVHLGLGGFGYGYSPYHEECGWQWVKYKKWNKWHQVHHQAQESLDLLLRHTRVPNSRHGRALTRPSSFKQTARSGAGPD